MKTFLKRVTYQIINSFTSGLALILTENRVQPPFLQISSQPPAPTQKVLEGSRSQGAGPLLQRLEGETVGYLCESLMFRNTFQALFQH